MLDYTFLFTHFRGLSRVTFVFKPSWQNPLVMFSAYNYGHKIQTTSKATTFCTKMTTPLK